MSSLTHCLQPGIDGVYPACGPDGNDQPGTEDWDFVTCPQCLHSMMGECDAQISEAHQTVATWLAVRVALMVRSTALAQEVAQQRNDE